MHLLRRILTGLVMASLALLPGASHARSVVGPAPLASSHASAAAHGAEPANHHAVADCAGHHPGHGGFPCRHPCKAYSMGCCVPAIIGLVAPVPVETGCVVLLRRSLPSADRRHADAAPIERLRPPIPL